MFLTKDDIEISFCYFFNCVHNENGNCLKKNIKIGYKGICMYKTIAKID